ncbi:citrate synthase-lysine N-methyltransferase CSKMT, mitochondrial isoform X1 [Xenopus tropicalis]|uniref:Citrate synthase-lysine N-methyltransferase CSKMT, mitochondrial n=2 Tax=Xenopus tropicalis TaxID=8364 RepID=A0A8J0S674_XENTR|nr:citrate synthase-lysine N-methyltransferase CSKMT, mitochondrial isoform X1 [Xenopus tropicalis]XP_031756544.1 citrate synthase-lysine N-methyltransferase CSKMT, mitochondrial isoform X1 [Xenopus tropicalis]
MMLCFRRIFITSVRHYSTRKQGTDAGRWGESLRDNMGAAGTWDSIYNCCSPNGSLHFDWFFGYNHMRSFLHSLICDLAPQNYTGLPLHLIDLGCGTSDVGLGLFCDSPVPVLVSCIDRSAPAIFAMNNILTKGPPITPRHPDSCVQFIEGDATDLHDFPSASVSLVLDKGTSDSLLRSSRMEAHKMVKEALRVLHPKGKLVQLTDEDPDARLHFLEEAGAGPEVTFHNLGDSDGIFYYAYIVTPSSCSE